MVALSLRYDMRAPSIGAPTEELYKAALAQCAWADQLGFRAVYVGEHHGSEDGYCPSPIVFGAAIAAVTSRMHIRLSALLAVLQHPLHLAEDLAVLDIISGGRLELTLGLGYRAEEFAMFGIEQSDRVRRLEEALSVLAKAWTGEPFDYHGVKVMVRPQPLQRPRPSLVIGSSVESGARRAARLADGFDPPVSSLDMYRVFEDECRTLGIKAAPAHPRYDMRFLYVTEDPERDWPIVATYVLYPHNSYAAWTNEGTTTASSFRSAADVEAVIANPMYQLLTPDACLEYLASFPDDGEYIFQPLIGGLPPEIAWRSLTLLEQTVLPKITAKDPA
jgi:alkanesulfonate monooxygenase SsuD/methylene tetrahydromethanopterin reductase-like flavin-dependent oxidoreductase (luciferase family)